MKGILEGLRVVEGSAFVAAPLGGMKLAQLGADLIMINLLGRRDGGSEVDYTVNPQLGLPALTGPADSAVPTNHVFPAWDTIAGQMTCTALLAALRHRDRHGVGQLVTLALKDVGLAMPGNLGMLAEVAAAFKTHRVTWGPYRTVRQAIERDADLSTAHPMFSMLEQPGIGTYLAPATPLDFSAVPRLPAAPAPRLGQHTDEILLDVLGLSSSQVGALHDARIVADPII